MSTKAQAKSEAKLRERMVSIFVSYSSTDLELARAVVAACTGPGMRAFLAEDDLRVGEQLSTSLADQVSHSDLVVLLWTDSAAGSNWVHRELGHARSSNVRVLPIVVSGSSKLPADLQDTKYADATRGLESALTDVRAFAQQQVAQKAERRLHNDILAIGLIALGALFLHDRR